VILLQLGGSALLLLLAMSPAVLLRCSVQQETPRQQQ
jgi:hypothetical protein